MTFLVVSPVIGLILGHCFMLLVSWLAFSAERHRAERTFSHLQLPSAGAYSLGHGTNDAQKTMGIIAALLVASGKKEWTAGHYHFLGAKHEIAMWLRCHAAMAIGTMLGGWRIVKTMGSRITPHLRPIWWIFRRARRCHDDWPCNPRLRPHFHYPRYRRCCLGCGSNGRVACCAVDLGTAHRLCLGTNLSWSGSDRCPRSLARAIRPPPHCWQLILRNIERGVAGKRSNPRRKERPV